MKNLVKLLVVSLMLSACTTQNTEAAKERMIGFHPNPEIQEFPGTCEIRKEITLCLEHRIPWGLTPSVGLRFSSFA